MRGAHGRLGVQRAMELARPGSARRRCAARLRRPSGLAGRAGTGMKACGGKEPREWGVRCGREVAPPRGAGSWGWRSRAGAPELEPPETPMSFTKGRARQGCRRTSRAERPVPLLAGEGPCKSWSGRLSARNVRGGSSCAVAVSTDSGTARTAVVLQPDAANAKQHRGATSRRRRAACAGQPQLQRGEQAGRGGEAQQRRRREVIDRWCLGSWGRRWDGRDVRCRGRWRG